MRCTVARGLQGTGLCLRDRVAPPEPGQSLTRHADCAQLGWAELSPPCQGQQRFTDMIEQVEATQLRKSLRQELGEPEIAELSQDVDRPPERPPCLLIVLSSDLRLHQVRLKSSECPCNECRVCQALVERSLPHLSQGTESLDRIGIHLGLPEILNDLCSNLALGSRALARVGDLVSQARAREVIGKLGCDEAADKCPLLIGRA